MRAFNVSGEISGTSMVMTRTALAFVRIRQEYRPPIGPLPGMISSTNSVCFGYECASVPDAAVRGEPETQICYAQVLQSFVI